MSIDPLNAGRKTPKTPAPHRDVLPPRREVTSVEDHLGHFEKVRACLVNLAHKSGLRNSKEAERICGEGSVYHVALMFLEQSAVVRDIRSELAQLPDKEKLLDTFLSASMSLGQLHEQLIALGAMTPAGEPLIQSAKRGAKQKLGLGKTRPTLEWLNDERHQDRKDNERQLQGEADEIWRRHPDWSKSAVAQTLVGATSTGYSETSIRQKISKPTK
ncbi:hypothetical protein [Paracoccus saliphilus]|uniref:Uncharacterized protein n=1 Tax=Paracoccus saliphilus TaxID=405559 RepID=A0AA46A5S9_9RHOB|nr:hypothetical protein [Paracoccus saliphilus]WCR04552.1 hypothetical protein JHX88_07485 [Paracoccus saliphilus]SIS86676.1 hypothetical protein SAMN05421772_1076 [Paracoccus saliphilus]